MSYSCEVSTKSDFKGLLQTVPTGSLQRIFTAFIKFTVRQFFCFLDTVKTRYPYAL